MNWLTVDTRAARDALLRLPDVRDARVKKKLWGKIEILIQEREPLALARLGQKLFWLDAEGVLYAPAQEAFGPVLVEPQTVETERGRRLAELFYLVPLRALMAAPGNLLNRIATIRCEGSSMILTLRDGPDVFLSIYDVREGLAKLQRLLSLLPVSRLHRIDLRFERMLIVGHKARS